MALAVSGGADSLALLLLAHAARPAHIAVATVDHGLRAESANEAAMVAGICAAMGVPHAILPVTVAPGNVQAWAREARYTAMAAWMADAGLGALATAHHADDQAETLLMRLNRGSGVAGLAGVRTRRMVPGTQFPLLRPLLGWRRSDLAQLCTRAGLTPVLDPSNQDRQYDRAALRNHLAHAPWLNPVAIAASAGYCADADAAIDWAADQEWAAAVRATEDGFNYTPRAPRAVRLRVMGRMITRLTGTAPRGSGVARLLDNLEAGQTSTLGGVLARASSIGWAFVPEPARQS